MIALRGASVESLLAAGARRLRTAGVEQPWQESVLLACHLLGLDKAALLARPEREVAPDEAARFEAALERRARSEPLAYVLGEREFYGRPFTVDRRALVPRPETELLVEVALGELAGSPAATLIVEVGTGSGCLAATLALELPDAQVVAADLSRQALDLARENLRRYGLTRRVRLVRGDLLGWLRDGADLIVANLPYVPTEAYGELPPEVREYEPRLALDGGPGGARLIERLLEEARTLRISTLLAELDPRHAERVLESARRAFPVRAVDVLPDLAGRQRLLRLRRAA